MENKINFKMAAFVFLKIRKGEDDIRSISDLVEYFIDGKHKEVKQHFDLMKENSVFFASEYRDLQYRLYLCKPWSFKVRNNYDKNNTNIFYIVSILLNISIGSNKNFDKIMLFSN